MPSTAPSPDPLPRRPPESSPRVPVREVLSLDRLVIDAGTQVRSAIDDDVVVEYVEALADGAHFPPVVVFRADGAELLSDGFHRVVAYRKAGRSEIEADVYHGDRDDTLWFALGANRAHGHRPSRADKRRAIELAYRAWPDLSQVRIAAQVGCTHQYVSQVRRQLATTCKLTDRVVGVDGRRRAATRPASSSRVDSSSSSHTPGDSPAPVAAAGDSVAAVEFPRSAGLDRPAGAPESSARAPSEPQASHPSAPAVDRSDPSSSPGSPEPSGLDVSASQSTPNLSNRIVSVVAYDAKNLTAQEDLVEFAALDRAQLPGWIVDIEEARRNLGRLIRRLREVGDGSPSAPLED